MMRESTALGEPWRSFLNDLNAALEGAADFHCIGGFVVSQYYGFSRETRDLDVLTVVPRKAAATVFEIAGKGSALQRRHGVHIERGSGQWRLSSLLTLAATTWKDVLFSRRPTNCSPKWRADGKSFSASAPGSPDSRVLRTRCACWAMTISWPENGA
jgi:hypothetical protein